MAIPVNHGISMKLLIYAKYPRIRMYRWEVPSGVSDLLRLTVQTIENTYSQKPSLL